jgi:hypothetical protein
MTQELLYPTLSPGMQDMPVHPLSTGRGCCQTPVPSVSYTDPWARVIDVNLAKVDINDDPEACPQATTLALYYLVTTYSGEL